jgi:hypothetical protein
LAPPARISLSVDDIVTSFPEQVRHDATERARALD